MLHHHSKVMKPVLYVVLLILLTFWQLILHLTHTFTPNYLTKTLTVTTVTVLHNQPTVWVTWKPNKDKVPFAFSLPSVVRVLSLSLRQVCEKVVSIYRFYFFPFFFFNLTRRTNKRGITFSPVFFYTEYTGRQWKANIYPTGPTWLCQKILLLKINCVLRITASLCPVVIRENA